MTTRRLILASQSPRRQSLLSDAGYLFEIKPSDIDEESYPASILPTELAQLLAKTKAEKVSEEFPGDVVLAADTIVAFGDQILGKPKDAAHARKILELLAGTTHIVITGVSVICRATQFFRHTRVMSAVRMRLLTTAQIDRYIATNDWEGKAGGYGIQDKDPFVERIRGDFENIVGLPMKRVRALLAEAGIVPDRQ